MGAPTKHSIFCVASSLSRTGYTFSTNSQTRARPMRSASECYGAWQTHERFSVGFWDADLAAPLDAIRDILGTFDRHPQVELVMGSRVKLLGRSIERSAARHYLGRVFATLALNVLDLSVYDT